LLIEAFYSMKKSRFADSQIIEATKRVETWFGRARTALLVVIEI
jgi:hypothetical protein